MPLVHGKEFERVPIELYKLANDGVESICRQTYQAANHAAKPNKGRPLVSSKYIKEEIREQDCSVI
jgi:hypothetical protein